MNKYKNKELIVRKVTAAFVEKIFRFCGYDFNHDEFKKVIYNEENYKTDTLEKMKRYYDAYIYLLNNSNCYFTYSLINTFYFILKEESLDKSVGNDIVQCFFYLNEYSTIEKSIELHNQIKRLLKDSDNLDQMIIPLMFLNFVLVRGKIPTVKLVHKQLIKYEKLVDKKIELFEFLTNVISNQKFYDKNYFKNLEPITVEEIVKTFKNDKEMLENKYHVKSLILYGSFAKKLGRIDSDIDILVHIDMDQLLEEREKIILELKEYYTTKFNRFVDIQEVKIFFTNEFIKNIKQMKIII